MAIILIYSDLDCSLISVAFSLWRLGEEMAMRYVTHRGSPFPLLLLHLARGLSCSLPSSLFHSIIPKPLWQESRYANPDREGRDDGDDGYLYCVEVEPINQTAFEVGAVDHYAHSISARCVISGYRWRTWSRRTSKASSSELAWRNMVWRWVMSSTLAHGSLVRAPGNHAPVLGF